jgi:tetratricopeptide (TPR) repeat protein
MSEGGYHYGKTIRKYREKRGLTQQELAERWPRSHGGTGVDWRYVQAVEYGKKRLADPSTLRKLCDLLEIPPWEFGLSDYDPFDPQGLTGHGGRLLEETLNIAEALLRQTLAMRSLAPLPAVEKNAARLHSLFNYLSTQLPPPVRLERRLLSLYAQEQSLSGLMHFEHRRYRQALATFRAMHRTALELNDSVLTVHALQKVGVELKRIGRYQEAIQALEKARDLSFKTSRQVTAFSSAYLSQMYAAAGDTLRFERAINTAIALAEPLKSSYGDGTDFVFHKLSGIFLLRSRGYLYTHQPEKTLALHEELQRQIALDTNLWLDHRLHLYRARALLMLKEVEASIAAAREFLRSVTGWQSPHQLAKGRAFLEALERAGYGQVASVRDFGAELQEALHQTNR